MTNQYNNQIMNGNIEGRGSILEEGSDGQMEREGIEFFRVAREEAKLDTLKDVRVFSRYVHGTSRDYEGRPAIFFFPPLGVKYDWVERQIIELSQRPELSGKRIYASSPVELWMAIDGRLTKRKLDSGR